MGAAPAPIGTVVGASAASAPFVCGVNVGGLLCGVWCGVNVVWCECWHVCVCVCVLALGGTLTLFTLVSKSIDSLYSKARHV